MDVGVKLVPITILPFNPTRELKTTALRLKKAWELPEFSIDLVKSSAHLFASEICRSINTRPIPIKIRHKTTKSKYAGLFYYNNDTDTSSITMYTKCSFTNRKIILEDFIEYLIHEIGHYADISYVRLKKTLHTKAFYTRVNRLTKSVSDHCQIFDLKISQA